MSPWTIASLVMTGLSGLCTVVATVFDQKDRNDEIDKRLDERLSKMNETPNTEE